MLAAMPTMAETTYTFDNTVNVTDLGDKDNLNKLHSSVDWLIGVNLGNHTLTGGVSGASAQWWNGSWITTGITPSGSGTPNTYDLTGATIKIVDLDHSSLKAQGVGVYTNDSSAEFKLCDIDISGKFYGDETDSYLLHGFMHRTSSSDAFTGSVVGKDITLQANAGAVGVSFWHGLGNGTPNTSVQFNNINITSTENSLYASATGFAAGGTTSVASGAEVRLGDVTVNSAHTAFGVHFTGSVVGTVNVDKISATTNVAGYEATGLMLNAGSGVNTITIGTGGITARAVDTAAIGIHAWAGGGTFQDANLTLKGNILAVSTAATADVVGVRGKDIAITLENNVSILAYRGSEDALGIFTTGKLDINLNNYNLTTNSARADGGALTVKGNGRADLGIVTTTTGIAIGTNGDKTTVAVDLANSSFGGTNTIAANAVLEGYGETETVGHTAITFTGTFVDANFVNKAQFTHWYRDDTSVKSGGLRDYAYISDGFLSAFGIHNNFAVWNAVRDRMISGNGNRAPRRSYGQGYYGQAPCGCNACSPSYNLDPCGPVACDPCAPIDCDPCAPRGFYHAGFSPKTAWVNYIGRGDKYRSSYNDQDWKLSMNGVQVGSDLFRSRNAQFGLLFGYEAGKNTNALDKVDAKDMYVGAYAAQVLHSGADIRGVFSYGWQDYDMNRWHGGNLYTSSFKGRTMEGTLEIGKRRSAGFWSMRPVLGVDVISNEIKGAVETNATGGLDPIRYNKADLTQIFVRAGSDLRYRFSEFTLNSGLYYAYDVQGDDLRANVSHAWNPALAAPLVGTKPGRSLLLFNLGGECRLTHSFSVFGGYDGQAVLDRGKGFQSVAYVGGAVQW